MADTADQKNTVKSRSIEALKRHMGEELLAVFNNDKTVEIMLNPDGRLWVEELGEKDMRPIGSMTRSKAFAIIQNISGFQDKEITSEEPLLECQFPLDGSRFAAQIPPVSEGPVFALRKKAVAIFTLDQYVESGIMTEKQAATIKHAVTDHKNILIVGGTGSGKTTLGNAIIQEIVIESPTERIVIIEDTGEIQCSAENHIKYQTTTKVTMTQLLKTTLRMRPDRILVGEVRGEEALDLLDAWNTGHEGGIATLHANTKAVENVDAKTAAISGLVRLKSLVTRNPYAPSDIESLIAEAVHMIIYIARTSTGRQVKCILSVAGFENGEYITSHL